MIAISFSVGFILAVFLCLIIRIILRRKSGKVKIDTFPKAITSLIVLHGFLLVSLSYLFAWLDKDPVVDVSVALIGEVVGPTALYIVTNCVMNIFEKNELKFSKPLNMPKVKEAYEKSGAEEKEEEPEEEALG